MSVQRVPSEDKVERVYRVSLNDVCTELGIYESPKLTRYFQVIDGELVITFKGNVK